MACIYEIKNKQNGKLYIGSTNNFIRRKAEHISKLNAGTHENRHLQRAWKKYGKDEFVFSILEEVEEDKCFEIEQQYLDSVKPFKRRGYNICPDVNDLTKREAVTKNCIYEEVHQEGLIHVFCDKEFSSPYPRQIYCNECSRNAQAKRFKRINYYNETGLNSDNLFYWLYATPADEVARPNTSNGQCYLYGQNYLCMKNKSCNKAQRAKCEKYFVGLKRLEECEVVNV